MNISHDWLKAFVPHTLSAEQVRDLLTAHVATVEGFERLRADLAPFVVARVVETEKVPDTKLSFNKVDDGSGTLLEVVCGAPNVTAGAMYPFARSGTLMPAGFKIEKKKIRGFTSNGMLCSARELGLGDEHDGILELTTDAAPGTALLSVLPLGDVRLVLDVLPNRPDLLSHIGVAREVSALTGVAMLSALDALLSAEVEGAAAGRGVVLGAAARDARQASSGGATVRLEDAEGCPLYLGAVIRGISVGPSPAWLRERVEAAGMRSINNVVDITNYVLHGLGQPMHAFDLGTLAEGTIVVRRARAGEKMVTLDGVERALSGEMTMIADAKQSIAVAGVMGGRESEVTDKTTDIFLEVAYFDPKRTRLTRRALGLSTDASYRFERGIDPHGGEMALRVAVALMVAVAGGRVDGGMIAVGAAPASLRPVTLRPARVKAVLGADVSVDEITGYLTGIGFGVAGAGVGEGFGVAGASGGFGVAGELVVEPPSWRRDVTHEVDLIEDVARLHGYDRLPDTIEAYRPTTVPDHPLYLTGRRVRDALVAAGLAEVRPMPFVKGDDASHWRVTNPLAEDEPHLRRTVMESLRSRAEYNLTRMQGDVRIFEVGSIFEGRGRGAVEEEVRVGILLMGARHPRHFTDGATPAVIDAWDAKALAERVTRAAYPAGTIEVAPAAGDARRWTIVVDGTDVGAVGSEVLDAPVWAAPAFGIEITLGAMPLAAVCAPGTSVHGGERPAAVPPRSPVQYASLPVTPAAAFDLALLVGDDMPAGDVERVLRTSGGEMLESLELFDEFRGPGVPDGMRSLAWRLTFRHPDRTLRDKEIEGRRSQLLKSLENQLGVKPRTA